MLDQQLASLLGQAKAAGAPDLCDLPIPRARELYRQILGAAGRPAEAVQVRDLSMPGSEPGTTLGLRAYAPMGARALPVVLWYHGGGYVVGDVEGYDGLCRRLCLDANAVVVAVDYRLAPEHPFPAAWDDAVAALRWTASPAGTDALGIAADPRRLAVAGDSAGAVLALWACRQATGTGGPQVSFMALAYPPAAGGQGDFASRTVHAQGPTLTSRSMAFFSRHTFGEAAVAPDDRGAPLYAASLAGLPPGLLMLAALDPLRDEGLALAERMTAEGSLLAVVECHGLAHGFLTQGAAVRSAAWAVQHFGACLRDAMHPPA